MDPREWIGKRVFFWDATDTAIYGTVVGDRTIPGDVRIVLRYAFTGANGITGHVSPNRGEKIGRMRIPTVSQIATLYPLAMGMIRSTARLESHWYPRSQCFTHSISMSRLNCSSHFIMSLHSRKKVLTAGLFSPLRYES